LHFRGLGGHTASSSRAAYGRSGAVRRLDLDLFGQARSELVCELPGDVRHDAPAELGRLACHVKVGQDLHPGCRALVDHLRLDLRCGRATALGLSPARFENYACSASTFVMNLAVPA
jgi:hypothetical protein